LIGEGIVTEKGERDGNWKEYYDDGKLKAEGRYDKDKKIGDWKFYHRSGTLEQEGSYAEGKPEGAWKWYYEDGQLLRDESYYKGLLDGEMTEYDREGNVITKGEYIEGKEDGPWYYKIASAEVEGNYADGMRSGEWKYYDLPDEENPKKVLRFEGKYIEDNPHGHHVYYWDNGNKKDEGDYVMGLKNGNWISYNYDGTPFLVVSYQNGTEIKYDGMNIYSENNSGD
jgi:uncharacterized protein